MSRSAELIKHLASLPPEVNRYDAAAAAIKAAIEPAKGPPWLHKATIAICALYGFQLVAAIIACVMLVKAADGRFWLIRRGREGIWTPNTQTLYCLFSAVFCATEIAALSWQAAIDTGAIKSYRNLVLFDALRWLPLYFAAGLFLFGLVAQTVSLQTDATRSLPPTNEAAWREQQGKLGSRWIPPVVNAIALAWTVLLFASVVVTFVLANASLNQAIAIQVAVCDSLRKASPSYDPRTFQIYQLLPLIAPASGMVEPGERFQRIIRIGWIIWCSWTCLLVAVFTPFLIKHLAVLRRLGMPSYWFWRKSDSRRSISVAAPAPALDFGSPGTSWKSDDLHPATPPGHQPSGTQLSAPKGFNGSHKLAGSLALSAAVVYLAGFIYIPLAAWAAATTLQDEAFWIGQLLLGRGSYASLGLFIHFVVIYRCTLVIRSRNALLTSGNSSHGKLSSGRRQLSRTVEEDSHFVSRGVWIETYVEVREDRDGRGLGMRPMGHSIPILIRREETEEVDEKRPAIHTLH